MALRRAANREDPLVRELTELVREGRALMMGLVRQELLSGVRTDSQFESLRSHLRAFPDISLEIADHEEAAAFFNKCRSQGVQGSTVDLLICAVAVRHQAAILTADGDFLHYARILSLTLHTPRVK